MLLRAGPTVQLCRPLGICSRLERRAFICVLDCALVNHSRVKTESNHRAQGDEGRRDTAQRTNIAAACVLGEYTGTRANFDRSARNTGSGTSVSNGTTSTTSVPNELVFAVLGTRGTYSTATTVFSSPTNAFAIVDQDNSTINAVNADRGGGIAS